MDQLFRSGSVFYNDAGYVTSTLNAKNETTSFGYDDAGRLLTITNGRGKTRTYTYKPRHEVDTLTLADGQTESWNYDANGNTSTYTNGLSQVITYTYNSANDQTGVDYPTGTDTSFGYDALGRWNSMTDATGTTSWVHNILGQVTSLTTPQGSYTYAYNAQYGRPETVTDVNGVWSKTYDQWHRSVGTTNPFGETTSVTFDNAGRVNRKDLASGMYETYSYDVMSRPEFIKVFNSADQLQDQKQYVWDEASRILQAREGGVWTTYTYDDIDQLLSETKGSPLSDVRSYTYDANGNRTTRTVNGVTETYYYNDADKLTSIVGGANPRSYTYDLAGRSDRIVDTNGLTQFGYDYDGRATSITYPNATSDNFGYNGLGARMSSTGVNGSKTFRRAGLGVTSSVLSDGTKEYTPGVSSRQNGASTFQHSGLKNALDQTDANELVTASRHYDAYGNIVQSTGTWQGAFGYAGNSGYQEDGNGLKLLGHRYYDSDAGRFMTEDPSGWGSNWYAYAGNNPVTNGDPSGLKAIGPTAPLHMRLGYQPYQPKPGFWQRFGDGVSGYFEGARAWWKGGDAQGPNGEPVRIGGWHSAFFNAKGNAMTVNGTVHLNGYEDYSGYVDGAGKRHPGYLSSTYWSQHETRHIGQEEELYGGNSYAFVQAVVVGYILGGSHDNAPLEIDADNHAGRLYKDPYSKGLWPWIIPTGGRLR